MCITTADSKTSVRHLPIILILSMINSTPSKRFSALMSQKHRHPLAPLMREKEVQHPPITLVITLLDTTEETIKQLQRQIRGCFSNFLHIKAVSADELLLPIYQDASMHTHTHTHTHTQFIRRQETPVYLQHQSPTPALTR